MKKLFVPIFLITVSFQISNAQVRHLKGQQGLEAFAGITKHSQVFGGGFSYYLSSKLYLKGSLGYETGTITEVDFTAYLVDVSCNYTLFDINSVAFFNVLLGGSGLYEETESMESTIAQEGFSPGVLGGVEMEIFLSDRLVIVAGGSQRHYFLSELGADRWLATGGLKYIL